jgi:hypothetical protein
MSVRVESERRPHFVPNMIGYTPTGGTKFRNILCCRLSQTLV